MVKIATHDGAFHMDDVCAVALVKLNLTIQSVSDDIVVRRSRNPKDWEWADIVLDVGDKYEGKFFDHHQEGVPYYTNGIKMASCGLYLESMPLSAFEKDYLLGRGLFAEQASDNGQQANIYDPKLYKYFVRNPFTFVNTFNQNWKSGFYCPEQDSAFLEAVDIAYRILSNIFLDSQCCNDAQDLFRKAVENMKNHIIVFDKYCPYSSYAINYNCNKPNILVAVYPHNPEKWCVRAVKKNNFSFQTWADIPYISDLPGAVFLHPKKFIAIFTNKESAIKAANRTVQCFLNNEKMNLNMKISPLDCIF